MRVGILTREPQGSAARLTEAFKARGHRVRRLDTLRLTVELGGPEPFLYRGKPFIRPDAVLPRIGHSATSHGAAVLRQLERSGVYLTASAEALLASRDKLRALQELHARGVAVPPTIYVAQSRDLAAAIERLGGPPLIVKVTSGTQGRGVLLAESARSAEAMADALLLAGQPVLLQRFIAESRGRDIRAFVVGDRVVAAARRSAQGDEYRSNVHLGAQADAVTPPPAFVECALRASEALGLDVAGVDMLEARDGPVVVEVNSTPGIVGLEEVTGVDVAGAVVEFVEERVASRPGR